VDFHEIWQEDYTIEDDLGAICFFIPIASTIPQWLTFELLRCLHLLNRVVDLDEILYSGDDSEGDLDHSKMADV
jgi:hypothetical protein